ncbi:MAG: AAA family ATPase [Candidatus Thermoplasmatota archaeon]|nr:AAA family ATPase [Candidatus Thermoplasmatota archaeon]
MAHSPPPMVDSPSVHGGQSTVDAISTQVLKKVGTLVVGDRNILQDNYVPPRLLHRDAQIRDLVNILAPAYEGRMPSHLLVYGKTGTGKTAVVTQVLNDIKTKAPPDAGVQFVSLNCAGADTEYAVLKNLTNSLTGPNEKKIGEKLGTSTVLDEFKNVLQRKSKLLLIVLDEIDMLVKEKGDAVLYSLSNLNAELPKSRVALIGVSNDLKVTQYLDARVNSRLNEQSVVFPPYNQPQLRDILHDRARQVLAPNALVDGTLERCAAMAAIEHGDARRAIALMRLSIQAAEREGAKQITEDHVKKAAVELERNAIEQCIRTLPPQEKFLLWALLAAYDKSAKPMPTGRVYEVYQTVMGKVGLSPLSQKTITDYISDMDNLGLIHSNIHYGGYAMGRTRLNTPATATDTALQILEEAEPLLQGLRKRDAAGQQKFY